MPHLELEQETDPGSTAVDHLVRVGLREVENGAGTILATGSRRNSGRRDAGAGDGGGVGLRGKNLFDINIGVAVKFDSNEVLDDLLARVVGRPITARRLAGNSLLVYIDGCPGDSTGVTFWFQPTWNLRSQTEVLTGSRQAQSSEDDQPEDEADAAKVEPSGFERAAAAIDLLVGEVVEWVSVDPVTGDLRVGTSKGYTVSTFISDPTDEEFWHIRDNVSSRVLECGAGGLSVHSL